MKESHSLPIGPEPAQGFSGLSALFNAPQAQPQPQPSIEQCIDPPLRGHALGGSWAAANQGVAVSQHSPELAVDKDESLPACSPSQKLSGRQSPWPSTCIPWRASRGFCVLQSVGLGLKGFQAQHPGQLRRRIGAAVGLVLIVASVVAGVGGLLSQEQLIAEQEAKLVGAFALGQPSAVAAARSEASEPKPAQPQELPLELSLSHGMTHPDDLLEKVSPVNALAEPPLVAGFLPATASVSPRPGRATKRLESELPQWWCLLGPDNQCVPM